MELEKRRKNHSIKTLIDLGTKGYYPLLHPEWIEEVCRSGSLTLSTQETVRAKEIMRQVVKHKSLERKKTVLLALPHQDRMLFVRSFLAMVEGKVLGKKKEFH